MLLNICRRSFASHSKVMITAALNGVLTDPKEFNVPVTPEQLAIAAEEVHQAGASAVHVHIRNQQPGKGHLPSWDPVVAKDCIDAIRERVPGLIINLTTGTVGKEGDMGGGPLGPTDGPISCLESVRPDMAALNSGSLNYLKTTAKGTWAWPPMLFDNTVSKVTKMVEAMKARNIIPECECFDTGIVRSIKLYEQVGILKKPVHTSLVMGVASGMPASAEWLPLIVKELDPQTHWQVIAIGRHQQIWPLLKRACELGGNLRTGLEDTFYLPDGSKAKSSGELVAALAKIVADCGKVPMTIAEAREHISKPREE